MANVNPDPSLWIALAFYTVLVLIGGSLPLIGRWIGRLVPFLLLVVWIPALFWSFPKLGIVVAGLVGWRLVKRYGWRHVLGMIALLALFWQLTMSAWKRGGGDMIGALPSAAYDTFMLALTAAVFLWGLRLFWTTPLVSKVVGGWTGETVRLRQLQEHQVITGRVQSGRGRALAWTGRRLGKTWGADLEAQRAREAEDLRAAERLEKARQRERERRAAKAELDAEDGIPQAPKTKAKTRAKKAAEPVIVLASASTPVSTEHLPRPKASRGA